MEPGTKLGPYEITEQLGAGSMGEVWLAQDTRLGRKVAIKVLPAEFASDPERLARFEQEARAAAALNHPHIASVFDVGTEDGTHFMVQEYLEGETLREPLGKGALPLKKTLRLATEIADALAAAHAAGIIHRDLKPENIFVTMEGHAKVLDFGLAKLTEVAVTGSPGDATQSPTMMGTVVGQVMGTAGYMAPEQVEGSDKLDHRADLFAFGCVLYEMAAGRQAFGGKNVHETLGQILSDEPPAIGEIDRSLPMELRRIVRKSLAKEPAKRYQTAGDLVVDMRALGADVESGAAAASAGPEAAPPAAAGGPSWVIAAALAAAVGLLAAGAAWMLHPATPSSTGPVMRFEIGLAGTPVDLEFGPGAALSRDGLTIAIAAEGGLEVEGMYWSGGLYVRGIDEDEATMLVELPVDNPVFSPDGQWISYEQIGSTWKVPVAGGAPTLVAESPSDRGTAWLPDGDLLLVPTAGRWRVPRSVRRRRARAGHNAPRRRGGASLAAGATRRPAHAVRRGRRRLRLGRRHHRGGQPRERRAAGRAPHRLCTPLREYGPPAVRQPRGAVCRAVRPRIAAGHRTERQGPR